MMKLLEQRGQLENTLIVATSDHGMPFPRCKGQAYDYSNHVPLAVMWPARIKKPGRVVDDYVSFIDLAPTFVEAAGVEWAKTGMASSPGRSLLELFETEQAGRVIPQRDHVLIGKERHDVGRPHDWGYPIRGIVKNDMLYIHNYEIARWPAGNPETGYLNCDAGMTKTVILQMRRSGEDTRHWEQCFGKRPAEELYNLARDPDCVNNLAADPDSAELKANLAEQMTAKLKAQRDPRMEGRGEYFDQIPYVNSGTRNFYQRYMNGEKVTAGWVSPNDFEKQPLD